MYTTIATSTGIDRTNNTVKCIADFGDKKRITGVDIYVSVMTDNIGGERNFKNIMPIKQFDFLIGEHNNKNCFIQCDMRVIGCYLLEDITVTLEELDRMRKLLEIKKKRINEDKYIDEEDRKYLLDNIKIVIYRVNIRVNFYVTNKIVDSSMFDNYEDYERHIIFESFNIDKLPKIDKIDCSLILDDSYEYYEHVEYVFNCPDDDEN